MVLSWRRKVTGDSSLGKKENLGNNTFRANGNVVLNHQYTPGDEQRMVIPLLPTKDGKLRPLLIGVPIHRTNNNADALEFPKKDGSTFKGFQIRSNHPYANTALGLYGDAHTIAERGETCVIAELIYLQQQKAWKEARAKFGEDLKNLDEDKKAELRDFMKGQEDHYYFKPNYYPETTTRDGEVIPARTMDDTVMLLLHYETETTIQKTAAGVEKPVETVVLDENGQPKYQPVLFSISGTRSQKIQEAVDNAIDMGTLTADDLHPYVEFEGTDDEVTDVIGWVDLTFKWPKGTKKDAGRNLTILAVPGNKQDTTPELIEKLSGDEGQKLAENAKNLFYSRPSNKLRTRQEQLDVLSTEALRTYEELSEEFADDLAVYRENFKKSVFDRILSNGSNEDYEEDKGEAEPVKEEAKSTSKEEPKEAPKEKKASKSKDNIQDLLDMVSGK